MVSVKIFIEGKITMLKKRIGRRQFLKRTAGIIAAATGFPYIVKSSVFGANGTILPSERIVMGCIGVGGQGTYNMKAFLENREVRVVAVCDVDANNRNSARNVVDKKYSNKDCAVYNDFRELLARGDIDAVTVCTPDHWHGLIAIAAAKAGKDIYCEKPLTNTIEEGRMLCDAVQRYSRVLQTGSHERSNNSARYACELVRNGRIGKLHTIRINLPCTDEHHLKILNDKEEHSVMPVPAAFDYDRWLGPAPFESYTVKRCHFFWRFIMDYGGGEMTDRGAHIIDLAQLGNGTDDTGPVELQAKGIVPKSTLFNTYFNFDFECKYANGVRMVGSSVEPRGLKFEGSDGWVFIHIHGGRLEAEPKSLLKEVIHPNEIHLGRSPEHHRNFLNAVKARCKPIAPVEVGYHTAVICHLLNISMQTGRKLKWDPGAEQIIDDAAANNLLSRPMRGNWQDA